MKITINEKEYTIKYTIRALFIFEQITGRAFSINNTLDNYIFFYSMLLANNKEATITWDEFIDALDSDPAIFKQIMDSVEETQKKNEVFEKEDSEGNKKKLK